MKLMNQISHKQYCYLLLMMKEAGIIELKEEYPVIKINEKNDVKPTSVDGFSVNEYNKLLELSKQLGLVPDNENSKVNSIGPKTI